jgi:hypothetical protein
MAHGHDRRRNTRDSAINPSVPRASKALPRVGFGKLRRLRKETARIQDRIDTAFAVIESRDPA